MNGTFEEIYDETGRHRGTVTWHPGWFCGEVEGHRSRLFPTEEEARAYVMSLEPIPILGGEIASEEEP